MKIIDIQPKDIYVNIELSLAEVDDVSLALSKSKIISDSDIEKASNTLTDFSKMLNEVLENVKSN